MPVLTDAEVRMVAEVVSELAKLRGTSFDKTATGFTVARAALIDPDFKARLVEVHSRIETLRSTTLAINLLAPVAQSLRKLERQAEAVVSGWREPDQEAD